MNRKVKHFKHTCSASIGIIKCFADCGINSYNTHLNAVAWRWHKPKIVLPLVYFSVDDMLFEVSPQKTYKLLSYKVLTTAQPSYLRNLISLQPPRSTRSSSVVTLSRPPTISSLKITDRSFSYASPCLWNQLSDSFRHPHHSRLDSPPNPLLNSSLSSSPLSSSITPSLFHSRLKTYLFNKSFPP